MIQSTQGPRTALVTGGSGAIGGAVVSRLIAAGARVINLDLNPPAKGRGALYAWADFSDLAGTRTVLAELTREHRIDWLVNNAGIALPATLDETTQSQYQQVMDVNVGASILCAQAVLPAMRAAGRGRIVNITSRAALGKPLRTAYSAAKAGLIGLTRTWALELAREGITVNAVGPGPIETPLFRSANPPDSARTRSIIAGVPVGRLGQPADVAEAVLFFLRDESSFVTGQVLFVCGGLSLGSG